MITTVQGDKWTALDVNGDITGATVFVVVEPAGGGTSIKLDTIVVTDATAGRFKVDTSTLPVGKYRAQAKVLQGSDPATFPTGYSTLIVLRTIPTP